MNQNEQNQNRRSLFVHFPAPLKFLKNKINTLETKSRGLSRAGKGSWSSRLICYVIGHKPMSPIRLQSGARMSLCTRCGEVV